MTDLAKLVIRMEAQTAQLQTELQKANGKLDAFARQAESAASKVGKVLAAGAAIGTAALARMVQQTIDTGDQYDKLSIRLGVSVENLSRFAFVAERSGVSTEAMNKSLQVLQKNLSEAATGTGESVNALNELGLSAKALTQLSPEQQFLALADSFETVENQSDKVRLAMKILGEEGVSLLQAMDGGSAAVAQLAAESDALGNTMDTKTAKAAAAVKDAITNMQAASNGAAQELFRNLAPQILSASKALQEILPKAANLAAEAFNWLQTEMIRAAGDFQRFVGEARGGIANLLDFFGADGLAGSFRKTGQEALDSADILYKMVQDRITNGNAELEQVAESTAPSLASIAPSLDGLRGYNATSADKSAAAKSEADTAKRIAAAEKENAQIISLQQERFRRLHEEALSAAGLNEQLENERYAREQLQLQTELQRLQEKNLLTAEIQQQFREAEENAAAIHAANLLAIDEDAEAKRRELMNARLQAMGAFFGTLGTLVGEQSKAGRALLAAEKATALAQSLIALQVAIAKANAVGFPANIPAIAQAVATGASAIASIRGVQVAGARADGGPVSMGKSYLVGERGPELFTPGASGAITPHHAMGGLNVQIIENGQRGGTVERDRDTLRIFVDRVRAELSADIAQGRGVAGVMQQTYGLRRQGTG